MVGKTLRGDGICEVEVTLEALGLSGETRGASRCVYSFLPYLPDLNLIKCRVVLIVRLFLYQQADLTKKGYEGTKQWADDGFFFQLIESIVNLVTGKEGYSNSSSLHRTIGEPLCLRRVRPPRSRCDEAIVRGSLRGEARSGGSYQPRRWVR